MAADREVPESVSEQAVKPGEAEASTETEDKSTDPVELIQAELENTKGKHLRLYAEFENYKKKVQKDKEELIKYSNESMLYELLPVIDNLEMALKHACEGGLEASNC